MAKLTNEQLAGVLAVLSGGFIRAAAVKVVRAHINELEGDIRIRDIAMNKMTEQLDQAREDERRAVAAADRLQDNVVQLTAECRRLEAEFDEAREAKKIVLPREVAEALDWQFKVEGNDWPGVVADAFINSVDKRKQCLTDYAADNYPDFLRALVNGYTVEEPPTAEERMRAKVDALLNEHEIESPIPRERLVELLTLAAREAVAESQQAETQ